MSMTIIFAVIIFSLIIFVHELGHFITARLFGVTVHEFAIGMGPCIYSKTKNNIKYSVRAIPVGGFCAMEGENTVSDDEGALNNKPWYKKLVILAAGAAMNVVLGFIICTVLITVSSSVAGGISTPVVNSVVEGSEAAGFLKEGDRIVKVNKTKVNIVRDLNFAMMQNGSAPITLTVKRDGKLLSETVKPYETEYTDGSKAYIVGITTKPVKPSVFSVLHESFFQTVWMGKTVFISIGMLIGGKVGMNEMSGPVGVVSAMNETAQASGGGLPGFLNLLFLSAFISVNIGIMNLLPFPALDGGRILFTLVEAIRRKPVPPEKEGFVHMIGFVLLIALMIFATWNDIVRLFAKQ